MFGFPMEIWLVCICAALVKVKYTTSSKTSCFGRTTDYIISLVAAVISGVFLHQWAVGYLGYSEAAAIPMAVLITLSAESVMSKIMELVSKLNLDKLLGYVKSK